MTGPTSSGKTTTLYATLNELNEVTEKIITTEEPVEYDIDGLVQGADQRRDRRDLRRLPPRAILRQDPDKILVGETRDLETAEIAIRGVAHRARRVHDLAHQRRPSAITRLRDMGLPTFLITATIQGCSPSGSSARSAPTAGPSSSPARKSPWSWG